MLLETVAPNPKDRAWKNTFEKRFWLCLVLFFVCTGTLTPVGAYAAPKITISAEAAALIDVTSGRILHSVKGDKAIIASLTKIMTAIVLIEYGNLADKAKLAKTLSARACPSILS